ncbi:pilus assembly protein [Vibrio metoecus]|nr:pilus assembly protein [Vibrio metoecus]
MLVFLCRGFVTVANLTFLGCQLHSFGCWTCVCLILLRKMPFKKKWLKVILKQ